MRHVRGLCGARLREGAYSLPGLPEGDTMNVWMLVTLGTVTVPVCLWLPVERWSVLVAEARHRLMAAERGS